MTDTSADLSSDNTEQSSQCSKIEKYVILSPEWPYQQWQTVTTEEAKQARIVTAHKVLDLPKDRPNADCRHSPKFDKSNAGTNEDITHEGYMDDINDKNESDSEKRLDIQRKSRLYREREDKMSHLSNHKDTPQTSISTDALNEKITEEDCLDTLYKRVQEHAAENPESADYELDETQNVVNRQTNLHTFLELLNDDLNVNLDSCAENPVMIEINGMIEDVVNHLRDTNELFKECKLLRAGSVAEKTKIGKLNEFDFLLVIERFKYRNEFSMLLDINWVTIRARNVPENAKLFTLYPSLFELVEDDSTLHLTNIRDVLMGLFLDLFRKSLLDDWKIVTTDEDRICSSDIATTLHFASQKHNIDVDVDICLCIPVSEEDVSLATSYLKEERSITFFGYIKCLLEQIEELHKSVFAIVGREEHLFSFPTSGTRITVPLLELSRFLHYGPNDGRVITYRLAKCIASSFFPKATKLYGCPRCSHCIVKSYHLKNIILSMMKNYSNDRMWTKEKVPYRLVEVYDILLKCIPDVSERNDKVATISTCCTPGTLRVDCISTYNPFTPNYRRPRDKFLFTQDSHKPMHDLSYCPKYEGHLKTGTYEIDKKVKMYFDYLNVEHWDSYEIIEKAVALLHELIME